MKKDLDANYALPDLAARWRVVRMRSRVNEVLQRGGAAAGYVSVLKNSEFKGRSLWERLEAVNAVRAPVVVDGGGQHQARLRTDL